MNYLIKEKEIYRELNIYLNKMKREMKIDNKQIIYKLKKNKK
jgi:hypothetical protein